MPTATTAKQAIYDAYAMRDNPAADRQVIGFTTQALKGVAQAEIRRQASALGYPDSPVTLTDPELLQSFTDFATELAGSITRGYNGSLQAYVSSLPDDATPETANMQPFYDSVSAYNKTTLRTLVNNTGRQTSHDAFYDRNGLTDKVPWTWTRNTDAEPDECQAAADASPASYAELVDIAGDVPPTHRNCGCTLSAGEIDPADLPDAADLWTGE